MAEGGKSHRKKKAGRKADKRKAAESKKKGTAGDGDARKQNPKAFIFASRGKAKLQRARTAERDQRRMHGKQTIFCLDVWMNSHSFSKLGIPQ